MSDARKASDLPVQTYEPEVSCGMWCQGGLAVMKPTEMPQHTDADACWVRGDEMLSEINRLTAERNALKAEVERLRGTLQTLACLGSGDRWGNSIGNRIAQDALEGGRSDIGAGPLLLDILAVARQQDEDQANQPG